MCCIYVNSCICNHNLTDVESESSQEKETSSSYSPSGIQARPDDGISVQLQDLNCEPQDTISNSPSSGTGGDEQRLLNYRYYTILSLFYIHDELHVVHIRYFYNNAELFLSQLFC